MTVASLALEELVIELTTNSSADSSGTCCAKDIWKAFIKIRKPNKTTTDNVVRIVQGFEEKMNFRIQYLQQNNLCMLYLRCFTTTDYNLGECVDILKY
jgi:hypothetical protein